MAVPFCGLPCRGDGPCRTSIARFSRSRSSISTASMSGMGISRDAFRKLSPDLYPAPSSDVSHLPENRGVFVKHYLNMFREARPRHTKTRSGNVHHCGPMAWPEIIEALHLRDIAAGISHLPVTIRCHRTHRMIRGVNRCLR